MFINVAKIVFLFINTKFLGNFIQLLFNLRGGLFQNVDDLEWGNDAGMSFI